jgi:hypothetical protein
MDDVPMTADEDVRREVVLVTRPAPSRSSAPDPLGTLREVFTSSVGMAA